MRVTVETYPELLDEVYALEATGATVEAQRAIVLTLHRLRQKGGLAELGGMVAAMDENQISPNNLKVFLDMFSLFGLALEDLGARARARGLAFGLTQPQVDALFLGY